MSKSRIFSDNYRYPNLTLFSLILVLTYFLYHSGFFDRLASGLDSLGYFGVLLVGMFFVSTFTVAPATAILFLMLRRYSVAEIAFVGGIGSVIGDYIIFRFIKDDLADELKDIFRRVSGDYFLKFHWIVHTRYFGWLGPVIGALIIASPFPDELGIGLLGIYKMSDRKFVLLSWVLDTIGIFLLLGAVNSIK